MPFAMLIMSKLHTIKSRFNFSSAVKLYSCIDNIVDKRANGCFYKTYGELKKTVGNHLPVKNDDSL